LYKTLFSREKDGSVLSPVALKPKSFSDRDTFVFLNWKVNAKWVVFIIALISGFALFTMEDGLRQAIARYIFFCLITAIVVRPLGIAVGSFLRRMFKGN
jgi:ABC-type phosphate transport system permease subunit